MKIEELIFVYNADSTLFASATDFIKKIATPDKYDCNLCLVTYGTMTMKSPWKKFLDTLPYTKTFLHRDEYNKKYQPKLRMPLPVILYVNGDGYTEVLVSAQSLDRAKNIDAMKVLVEDGLKAVASQK